MLIYIQPQGISFYANIYVGFIIGLLVAGFCFVMYYKTIGLGEKPKSSTETVDKPSTNWDNYVHLIAYILVIMGMILNVIVYSF